MKTIGWCILILLVLHLVAAVGFVGWLAATDRLSSERVQAAVDLFQLTLAEEQAQDQQAAEVAAEARDLAERAARLEAVAHGPKTLQDRFELEEAADALAMHRLERLQRETGDLRRQIEQAQERLVEQKSQLEAERDAFDAFVERTTQKIQEEDFQQAVRMYEQLKPDQAKQMLQSLMTQGQTEQVVQYLAAMQLRKAGAVLKEFETPAEIEQATQLVEMLRQRGVYPSGAPAMVEAKP